MKATVQDRRRHARAMAWHAIGSFGQGDSAPRWYVFRTGEAVPVGAYVTRAAARAVAREAVTA